MKPTLKVAVVTGTSLAPGTADEEYKSADQYPAGSRHNWTRSNAILSVVKRTFLQLGQP